MKRSTKPMNQVSKKRANKNRDERDVRLAYKKAHPYCEAKHHVCNCPDKIPGECFGELSIHEPWTRARGGPTDDELNMRVVCFEHNRMLSQDPKTMEWGLMHSFLVKAADGPAWLERQKARKERGLLK